MTTQVKTETGKLLGVKDFFNNNGKGSYDGKVLVNGKEVYTYWFFQLTTKKITFLTSAFYIDGQKYTATGEVTEMSLELKQRLEDTIEKELNKKQEDISERISQMYQY